MATSTQLAQALALKKQNPNLTTQEAVLQTKQATTTLTPTPTVTTTATPTVTPTTPPSTTSPIPQTSTLGKAQAIRDAQGGTLRNAVSQVEGNVGTQTFTQAPINPETGLSAPQTSQPTPQPTQAPVETQTPTPTTPPPVDKSAEIQAQNTAKMAENAQKSQLAIQERKSQAQDQAIANIPTDQKSITQSLISGVSVPNQNTQAYRNALVTYNEFKRFNGMTDVQFLDNLKQGQVSDEMDSLLSQNPNFAKAKAEFAKFQKTSSINSATQIASNIISGKEPTPVDNLSNIESKYNAPPGTNVEAYQKYVVQNEDVVRAGLKIKTLDDQIATVNKTYTDALKSLKQQYPDMPASALLTLMGSRTKDTKEVLDDLINQQTSAKGNFDMAMKMAEGSYGAYSLDLQQQQEIAKEQRTMKNSLALSQMQFDQKIAQQAQAMNDPVQAISTMVEEYKKLGIPFSRSTQQIIQEFQASGKPLAQYLTELQGQIQSKPEYQAYKDKQTGTEWQSTNITRYNPSTGANESTPIFYRKKTSGGFEAVDLSGNPIDVSSLTGGGITGGGTPTGGYATTTTEMRTDRNMNPTAMTTDVARSMGLKEGVDYVQGDSFKSGNGVLYTAKLLGDPIETTIRAIDNGGFTTKSGQNRWTYTASMGLTNDKWKNMTYDQKVEAVKQMYRHEGGNGTAIGETKQTAPVEVSMSDQKAFESYDGKTIPEQYKTPAEKKAFVEKYNAWADSQASGQIKTGQDIINIRVSSKATEGEKAALQYASRALNVINDLPQYEDAFAKLPLKDQLFQQYAPDILKSDNQKILEARKKDFITAILRKESGASISPTEFANEEKKYFAQPGNSQSVIVAKQNARNFAIKSLLTGAGQDVNGKSINTLYNPPVITANTGGESIADRLERLRKK